MNTEGREVVKLWANKDGGGIDVHNKAGTPAIVMGAPKDDDWEWKPWSCFILNNLWCTKKEV